MTQPKVRVTATRYDREQPGAAGAPAGTRGTYLNTLQPYIDAYMRHRLALGTYGPKSNVVVRPRLLSLARHHGRRPLTQFTERAVVAWLESLAIKQNSRSSYLASVRTFTAWLTREGVVRADPCADLPPIKRTPPNPRAQDRDAVATVLSCCESPRDEAIVILMVELGLRRMEVAGARWEHYDERGELLTITGKRDKVRVLPVTQATQKALGRIRFSSTGPIIASYWNQQEPISPERVGQIVSRAMAAAGVKRFAYDGVSGHALRHTAASDVLDACGDLRVVQQMLGHDFLSSTAIYLRKASAESIRTAMEGRDYGAPSAADVA